MIQKILILIPLELSLILLTSFSLVIMFREGDDTVYKVFSVVIAVFCVIVGIVTAIGILGT